MHTTDTQHTTHNTYIPLTHHGHTKHTPCAHQSHSKPLINITGGGVWLECDLFCFFENVRKLFQLFENVHFWDWIYCVSSIGLHHWVEQPNFESPDWRSAAHIHKTHRNLFHSRFANRSSTGPLSRRNRRDSITSAPAFTRAFAHNTSFYHGMAWHGMVWYGPFFHAFSVITAI